MSGYYKTRITAGKPNYFPSLLGMIGCRILAPCMLAVLLSFSDYAMASDYYPGGAIPEKETIASYTKMINSGRFEGVELAGMYQERGFIYTRLDQLDKALQDYTDALRLNPNYIIAYINRSIVLQKLGKYQEAFHDLNDAQALDPNNTDVYRTRGNLNFILKQYAAAAQDFETFLRITPSDQYRMIWLYLSEKNLDRDAQWKLSRYAKHANLDQWPGAMIHLYLGDTTYQLVVQALTGNARGFSIGNICEAYFYLAQYFLIHNDQTTAIKYFQKAADTKAKNFLEYELSLHYLRELKK
jgi:lipoprotein NlpI